MIHERVHRTSSLPGSDTRLYVFSLSPTFFLLSLLMLLRVVGKNNEMRWMFLIHTHIIFSFALLRSSFLVNDLSVNFLSLTVAGCVDDEELRRPSSRSLPSPRQRVNPSRLTSYSCDTDDVVLLARRMQMSGLDAEGPLGAPARPPTDPVQSEV